MKSQALFQIDTTERLEESCIEASSDSCNIRALNSFAFVKTLFKLIEAESI